MMRGLNHSMLVGDRSLVVLIASETKFRNGASPVLMVETPLLVIASQKMLS
jgi:hypothetical protein